MVLWPLLRGVAPSAASAHSVGGCLRVPPWRERAAGKTDMEPLPVFGVTAARTGSDDGVRSNAVRWGGGAGRAFAAMDMNKAQLAYRMRYLATAAARQARSLAPGARPTRWNQLR